MQSDLKLSGHFVFPNLLHIHISPVRIQVEKLLFILDSDVLGHQQAGLKVEWEIREITDDSLSPLAIQESQWFVLDHFAPNHKLPEAVVISN
jgi:hypothetical protein